MDMKEKALKICREAAEGKTDPDSFYDRLSAIADDTRTEDDLVCILEDIIMELEMEAGSSKNAMRKMMKESAERLIKELEK